MACLWFSCNVIRICPNCVLLLLFQSVNVFLSLCAAWVDGLMEFYPFMGFVLGGSILQHKAS
jgi:hypothetical protein